ncbi:MAG: TolC family protein [Muribaculum sp.]|nr:TolC family protein [Muribaculaceae bacterium]MCM1081235.1 TolC family protein [Muribaculum sp.]
MNNLRLLTGLLATILLSGGVCAVGQEARVMSLDELFATAESNSLQLRPAYSAEKTAEKAVSEARTERLPDINASLSLSYIGDGFTTKRNFSDYQKAQIPHFGNTLSVNINQPVYTGGAISAGINLAELKLTAARYATEMQRDNIRFQLTGFYLDIYKYNNLRAVVESNIAQARKVLNEMNHKYSQGLVLQNDITRYELLVSNLELQLLKIDNTLTILNNNLVNIAGLPQGTTVSPDTTILERSLPTLGEAAWQSEAAENAPSLRLARSKVGITKKSETLLKSQYLPKIGLQAGWTVDGPILVEVPPINRNLSYWYVGLGVSYNLSSLYKSNKTLSRSRAASINARDELAAACQSTELSIRADYLRYMEAYEELKTQQKSVDLANRNYATVSTRYSTDMALITDLLDAASSKLNAEQMLVNARIDIIYYYYKLLFTSGKI